MTAAAAAAVLQPVWQYCTPVSKTNYSEFEWLVPKRDVSKDLVTKTGLLF